MGHTISLLRCAFLVCASVFCCALVAQETINDSSYWHMPDRAKAMEAIRFDLKSYHDTLRVYRDALDQAATRLDASTPEGQDRKALLGRLRSDVQALDKDMGRLLKQVKKTDPPFDETARKCALLLQHVKELRGRAAAQGAKPER